MRYFNKVIFILAFILVFNQLHAQKGLTKPEAELYAAQTLKSAIASFKATAKNNWDQKKIVLGQDTLKFGYRIFGQAPANGRSLYISLHGGGNAPKYVNDQQWINQMMLYQPKEGVYIAPRSPFNTWNLWHEAPIDALLDELIKTAMVAANVNPDKVYLMGYSAGGDGVYQLAPRMANYWAAASMMAGHPNDASLLSLYNLPFSIFMGGADSAYNRNKLAIKNSKTLDSLEKANPGNYIHTTHIYEGMPHWMNRKDTIALDWMPQFTRKALPPKIVWVQDDVLHENFYWLGVPNGSAKPGAKVIARIEGNTVYIEENDDKGLYVYLNDKLLDLNKKVKVNYLGKIIYNKKLKRINRIIEQSAEGLEAQLIFSTVIKIENGEISVEN